MRTFSSVVGLFVRYAAITGGLWQLVGLSTLPVLLTSSGNVPLGVWLAMLVKAFILLVGISIFWAAGKFVARLNRDQNV
jgi:hypothetical protein